MFPENGDAVKWKFRGPALEAEVLNYHPDLVFLQEIDQAKFDKFWVPICSKLGLKPHFATYPGKQHGLVIAFKEKYFELKDKKEIWYDSLHLKGFQMRPATKNTGIIAALKLKTECEEDADVAKQLKNTLFPGIVVATTHLYWHPYGSFERAIQCGQLIQETIKFSQTSGSGEYKHWPIIFGGDFNSSPDDLPYQFLIKQPKRAQELNKKAMEIATRSIAYLYGRHEFVKTLEIEADTPVPMRKEEIAIAENEEGFITEINPDYVNLCIDSILPLYSLDGRSSTDLSDSNAENDKVPRTVESIYGTYYAEVDPSNSSTHKPDFGEPEFSNWAHAWRGLLDYIFVVQEVEQVSGSNGKKVLVKELLKMPKGNEMGEEPSGQPRIGEYPSDHLCMMGVLEL